MRIRTRSAALAALALVIGSCSDSGVTSPHGPRPVAGPSFATTDDRGVRFSEIHYDNTGTDVGEAIELSGPAGKDLTGYSVVLYNGSGGAPYNTRALSGTIPATCGPRGVVVLTYPSNGIQNGSPDGMALVGPDGLVEFLSYEGVFTAVGGPADGVTSVDIGVSEAGTEPTTPTSLARTSSANSWSGPAANTFGTCNDDAAPATVATVTVTPSSTSVFLGGTTQFTAAAADAEGKGIAGVAFTWSSEGPAGVSETGLATGLAEGDARIIATAPNGMADTASLHVDAPPPDPDGPTFISEIHYDNDGPDAGERIEVEGPAGKNLSGWSIVLYNGNNGAVYATIALAGIIPASCEARGVLVFPGPSGGIQNGPSDGLALVRRIGPVDKVVEFLSYEGVLAAVGGPANGTTSTDIGVSQNEAPEGRSLQRDPATGLWYGGASASFGACNGPKPQPAISIFGRAAGDPPLPVGFEDQLFATERDGDGAEVPTTITWSTETPSLASIDQNGVVHARGEGMAVLRATAVDGATSTVSLPLRLAVASTTALYEGNTAFGEPHDADASDDFILRKPQYTVSYNKNRGTPNWVSYDLDPSHFGPEDRCDCFTFDPDLPSDFPHYTTADYTGAGAFHGYGIDRGHLARSFDRTSASLDNAQTFYFSNIIPQAADLNQGPWAVMESYLGDLVRFQNKEVYVIAGVAGSKGTLKNQNTITIPASVWKVAVIMPHDQGLANVHGIDDLEVIAVVMPNDPGVRNVNWETYKTTVDVVEALSHYDLLAALPDPIEVAVESQTKPPTAVIAGAIAGVEGGSVTMSAAGSSDPDVGDVLSYSWDFGDGTSGFGASVTHTYAQDGHYPVTLTVTDSRGLSDDASAAAQIVNVAPAVSAFGGAELLPGETYSAAGSFTDPGADVWTASVDYGDGTGNTPLALVAQSFALSHVFSSAGTYTVTVTVADDDLGSRRSAVVRVLTPARAVMNAIDLVDQLMHAGTITAGNANALQATLDAARRQLDRGGEHAVNQLGATLNQLDALTLSGRLSAADAAPLRTLVSRIVLSLGT